MTWDSDWDFDRGRWPRRSVSPKPRLERQRPELPRGGKDIAAQISAELRSVFAPPAANAGPEIDMLLAQIDLRHSEKLG